MTNTKEIDDFFNRYASIVNNALFGDTLDTETIRKFFANYVVGANPLGIAGGSNDEQFQKSIRQGIEFYRQIGITSMNISSKEITLLDDLHAMVKVFWKSFYSKDSTSGEICFDVVYIVQNIEDNPRIFAYITGDEQGALREHKLI
jgi:hypothetical protein